MATCRDLFFQLGITPAPLDAARTELDEVALETEHGERDDGDSVH